MPTTYCPRSSLYYLLFAVEGGRACIEINKKYPPAQWTYEAQLDRCHLLGPKADQTSAKLENSRLQPSQSRGSTPTTARATRDTRGYRQIHRDVNQRAHPDSRLIYLPPPLQGKRQSLVEPRNKRRYRDREKGPADMALQ